MPGMKTTGGGLYRKPARCRSPSPDVDAAARPAADLANAVDKTNFAGLTELQAKELAA